MLEKKLKVITGENSGIEGICSWNRKIEKKFTKSDVENYDLELSKKFIITGKEKINFKINNRIGKKVIINFDNEQFNRLFFNLIKNSIESIKEKVKKTNNSLKNIDIEINQRRDYINVNLIDTGEGFKDKKTKDIIKPYYTTKEKGTGLGLSIVDKIINDHNGSIKFLNTNNGAKVQIVIPK